MDKSPKKIRLISIAWVALGIFVIVTASGRTPRVSRERSSRDLPYGALDVTDPAVRSALNQAYDAYCLYKGTLEDPNATDDDILRAYGGLLTSPAMGSIIRTVANGPFREELDRFLGELTRSQVVSPEQLGQVLESVGRQ